MKVWFIRLNLLFSITSLLCLASCRPVQKAKTPEKPLVQPAPLQESKTDSLKNYLDEERARRKNQGKE